MTYSIELRPGGRRFNARAGQALLDAALAAGINLPYGCRNGACQSCRARIITGTVSASAHAQGLSASEREHGFTLLCQASANSDLVLEIEELDRDGLIQVRTLPLRVAQKTALAHDVMQLTLTPPANESLRFRAGQYIDILLRNGRRRAFSLANPSHIGDRLELHIRNVSGGSFSSYVFDALTERALLRMQGPLGNFYLREARGGPIILIAGGTGFAPIQSIILSALEAGLNRPLTLYCGVRAERDLYMDSRVKQWAARWPNLNYTPVLSQPDGDSNPDLRRGLVHEVVLEDFPHLAQADIYASGPPAMVDALRSVFPDHGADPGRIFCDAFVDAYLTGHEA